MFLKYEQALFETHSQMPPHSMASETGTREGGTINANYDLRLSVIGSGAADCLLAK